MRISTIVVRGLQNIALSSSPDAQQASVYALIQPYLGGLIEWLKRHHHDRSDSACGLSGGTLVAYFIGLSHWTGVNGAREGSISSHGFLWRSLLRVQHP